jgi:small subunit ribosomal protein S8
MSYINLMIQIKNAQAVGKGFLKVPYSKMDKAVADILLKKGLLKKVEVKGRQPKKVMKIYVKPSRPIKGVEFVSKPSRRIYKTCKELRPVKSGHGVLIVSTSKGILSGDEAKKEKVGGQVLFKVW